MNKMRRKLLCTLIVLIAALSAVSAATITWSWIPNDDNVSYYRYRLDEDDWTIVSSDITEYVQKDADNTRPYTLYLEQSYDGKNWSLASSGTTVIREEVQVEEILPVSPIEVQEQEESSISLSLLLKGGVSSRIPSGGVRINLGTAFDVANILTAGKYFGFGLRSDLTTDITLGQDIDGWKGINKDNFYKMDTSYDYDTSIDLKVMAEAHFDIARIYLGGGVGYSLFNQADTDEARETHTLKTFSVFGTSFDSAWFVSALTGVSFRITDLFSLGTEVSYRYMFPASAHTISADLVMGFTF